MSEYVDIYLLYQWIEPSYINLADDNNFFEKKKKKIQYKKKTETLYKICKSSKQRNIIYLDVKLTLKILPDSSNNNVYVHSFSSNNCLGIFTVFTISPIRILMLTYYCLDNNSKRINL